MGRLPVNLFVNYLGSHLFGPIPQVDPNEYSRLFLSGRNNNHPFAHALSKKVFKLSKSLTWSAIKIFKMFFGKQTLWHSWQSPRFRNQISASRHFYKNVDCIEKTKIKKKRPITVR